MLVPLRWKGPRPYLRRKWTELQLSKVAVLPSLLPHVLVHLLLPSPGRRPLIKIPGQPKGGLPSVAVVVDAVGVEVVGLLVVLV